MAKTFYPFDAGPGYDATEAEWAQMARLWLATGVVDAELDRLAVSADGADMTVDVATGAAWIRGFYFRSDAIETLTIADADPFDPRIDRVVVRLDRAGNLIDLAVLEGTPAAAPVAPSLTQDDVVWEIELAQVTVPANASAIAAGNVDDTRTIVTSPAFVAGGDAPDEATGFAWVRRADGAYVPVDVITAAEHTKALHDALGIDADTVDGEHASAFAPSGHSHPTPSIALGDLTNVTASGEGAGGGFDADTVDGQHASAFALSGHSHGGGTAVVTGTYTGNGASLRTISIGVTPFLVIIRAEPGSSDEIMFWHILSGGTYRTDSVVFTAYTVVSGGFEVGLVGGGPFTNRSGVVFSYVALGGS